MLHKIKVKAFELGHDVSLEPDFLAYQEKVVHLSAILTKSKHHIREFCKETCAFVDESVVLAQSYVHAFKDMGVPEEQEGYAAAKVSLELWASGLGGILSFSMDHSAGLVLDECRSQIEHIERRYPELQEIRRQFEYYSHKLQKFESELPEKKEKRDPEQIARNKMKLEDASEMYFITNETLKTKMMVAWEDRFDVLGAMLVSYVKSQQHFFFTMADSLQLMACDVQIMKIKTEPTLACVALGEKLKAKEAQKKRGVLDRFKRNVLGIGQGHKTVDAVFDSKMEAITAFGALIASTQSKLSSMLLQLEASHRASTEVASDVRQLFGDKECASNNVYRELVLQVSQANTSWSSLLERLRQRAQQVSAHIDSIAAVRTLIENRVKEREELRSVYDHCLYIAEKDAANPEKRGHKKEKHEKKRESAKKEYEAFNELVKTQELDVFLQSRASDLTAVLGSLLRAQHLFFEGIKDVLMHLEHAFPGAGKTPSKFSFGSEQRSASPSVAVSPSSRSANASMTITKSPAGSRSVSPSPSASASLKSPLPSKSPPAVSPTTTKSLASSTVSSPSSAPSLSSSASPPSAHCSASSASLRTESVASPSHQEAKLEVAPRPTPSPANLAAIRARYLDSAKEVETKAAGTIADLKNKREVVTISKEQTGEARAAIQGILSASMEKKSAVDNAMKQMTSFEPAAEGQAVVVDLNLNNTPVFRTMSEEQKHKKYKEICAALSVNVSIKTIEMTNAEVGNDFCLELAKVLESNTVIEELNLNSNPIGSAGVIALMKALEKNATLKVLKLHNLGLSVDKEAQQSILDMLKINMTLCKMVYVFPQRQDNDAKEKMCDRNVALARKRKMALKEESDAKEAKIKEEKEPMPSPRSSSSVSSENKEAIATTIDEKDEKSTQGEKFTQDDSHAASALSSSSLSSLSLSNSSCGGSVSSQEQEDNSKAGQMVHVSRPKVAGRKKRGPGARSPAPHSVDTAADHFNSQSVSMDVVVLEPAPSPVQGESEDEMLG